MTILAIYKVTRMEGIRVVSTKHGWAFLKWGLLNMNILAAISGLDL